MIINGLLIRELILRNNLQHSDVAAELGMSKQGWSSALNRESIKDEMVPVLARLLKVDPNQILKVRISSSALPETKGYVQNANIEVSEIIALARESIRLANSMMERFDRAMDTFERAMLDSKGKKRPAKERTGTSG